MTDRQSLFSGTEIPPAHLSIDAVALGRYLSARLDGMSGSIEVVKFKGGQSNPTYKISGSRRTYVLRKRPPGRLLESAHAIDREYRVLSALSQAGFPVPRTYLYCDDESIIGSQFYIVDFQQGRVFWNAELPGLQPAQRTVLYEDMVAQLAALHQLDFRSLGLADFGKTGNYTARNLARWSKQYSASRLVDIPDMEWLMQKLAQRLPATEETVLLHGDYGLYNIIVDPVETTILGVLDWEMATLGDPLVDLAHHTRPWWDPPDEAGASATSLIGRDLAQLGIPTLERHMQSYFKRRGLTSLLDIDFYIGYSQFRYAAMVQGILKRAQDGVGSSGKVLHTQQRVVEIAAVARRTLSKGS